MSPILDLQRRLREVGRIRIGEKGTSSGGKSIPKKLSTFRFTSRDQAVIEAAAQLYGGEVKPWQAGDGSAQFEVVTNAQVVQVVVPPADMAFSQFFELWSGGGCQRRCDGATESVGEQPCVCDPEKRDCSPHTRLSLIVPDLPVVGLFRLDTQGWNAAEELAGSVDLARSFAAAGRYLPAELRLETREKKKPGQQTKKFVVPCLDLKVQMNTLTELGGANGGGHPLMPGASPGFGKVPELPEVPASSIGEQVKAVGEPRARNQRANAAEPIRSTGVAPRPASQVSDVAGGSDMGSGPDGATSDDVSSPPSSGEIAGGTASPPVASDDDGYADARARQIAIRCREAGLDDDGRHAFLHAYSGGAWLSAKEVPQEDLAGVFAALVRVKRGQLELRKNEAGETVLYDLTLGLPSSDPGGQSPARRGGPVSMDDVVDAESREVAAAAPAGPVAWDEAAWKARAADVPGVGPVKLLKQARKLAEERGRPVPQSLNEVTDDQVVEAVLAWLEEQRAA